MSFDAAHCTLCPRRCGADREKGVGLCHCGTEIRIARAALHPWEEPCISGRHGSGTVFFSGCALGCVFCQNRKISRQAVGKAVTVTQLAEIFLKLQEQQAHNINLVTGSHYTPWIVQALELAKPKLHIPVVWNCGGYESPEILHMLEGLVDIYLPDLKFYTGNRRSICQLSGLFFSCSKGDSGNVPTGGKAGMERRFAGTRSGGTASGSAGTSKRINAAAGLAGGGSAYRCVFAKSDGTVHPAGNAAVGQAPEPANCHV